MTFNCGEIISALSHHGSQEESLLSESWHKIDIYIILDYIICRILLIKKDKDIQDLKDIWLRRIDPI